jgi:hypothetical protein
MIRLRDRRREVAATSLNLSVGGLFVQTSATLEPGAQAWLVMTVGDVTFEALAEVVHGQAGTGYGMKFIAMDPEGRRSICQLVDQLIASHDTGLLA